MSLFRRKSAEVAVAPLPPTLGDLPCSERGCPQRTGLSCAYVDRRGRECSTAWCPQHRAEVQGRAYCRRHAGVVRALEHSDTATAPDIGSRAASLVAWVATDIGDRVVEHLDRVREADEQLRIQAPRLVFTGRQRIRAWEAAWKLTRHTGLGHWVAVQVPEEQDDIVELIVDGLHVHRDVPPWIAARQAGRQTSPAEDLRLRERYYADLLEAVEVHLGRPAQRH